MKAFREVVSLLFPLLLASCAGSGSMVFSNVENVFDWEGNPVCKYLLHEGVDTIDINGGTLLTFDSETETLRRYKL